MISAAAGYLSGVAILLSFVPYVKDTFKGKTKPERISWLIWSILGSISFFSQFANERRDKALLKNREGDMQGGDSRVESPSFLML